MERENQLDNLHNEFVYAVKKVLNIPFYESYGGADILSAPASFELEMTQKNQDLIGSPFFYENKENLLHFTSLQALTSIIKEQNIRMYNMHISNDESEYTYAANTFKSIREKQGHKSQDIKEYFERMKTILFYLSLTKMNNLKNETLWEKYGDNKKGIAIEFSFLSNPEDWMHFYFSNVFYDQKYNFTPVFKVWNKIITKYPKYSYSIEISPLLALHKKAKKWQTEDEVRILLHNYKTIQLFDFGKIEDQISIDFRSDKNRIDKDIKYFKLPLYNLTDKKPYNINYETLERCKGVYPQLKITNIYFGNDWISRPDKANLIFSEIKYLIFEKLGYYLPRFDYLKNIINLNK